MGRCGRIGRAGLRVVARKVHGLEPEDAEMNAILLAVALAGPLYHLSKVVASDSWRNGVVV